MKRIIYEVMSQERASPALVECGVELSGLPTNVVERTIKEIYETKSLEHYGTFLLFKHATLNGNYWQADKRSQDISALRCLALLDKTQAEEILSDTVPPGNIINALERSHPRSVLLEYQHTIYLVQYSIGCSIESAITHATNCDSVLTIIGKTRRRRYIDNLTADIAFHSFCFLQDPIEIHRIVRQEKITSDDF